MAKTLNSISFSVLLVVLVMASTGILKSEALDCINKGTATCSLPAQRVFLGECPPEPFVGGDCPCCLCCLKTYGSPQVCWAVVEGSDSHCHCYKHV